MQAWYMSGAGNDFVVIDARGLSLDFSAMALEQCENKHCDGFMAVDYSDHAHFKLHFYNADGSRGEMCGNGSRCVAKFAYDHGIAPAEMTIETDAGLLTATRMGETQFRVKLNNPGIVDLHRHGNMAYIELGTPGVPHGVFHYPGLTWEMREALRERMKAERYADYFPKGANVNYFDWIGQNRIRILTYERGVEDFTLACGTGSGATAVKLWLEGAIPEGRLTVENPGGTLTFQLQGTPGMVTEILMTGPAEVLEIFDIS